MASVLDIFEVMSYGDVKESSSLGKEWLMNKEFGPFINGTWETSRKEDKDRVIIDCLGDIIVSVGSATPEDVDKAVTSCLDAQINWNSIGSKREVYLLNLVKYLEKDAALLAQVDAINRGVQVKDPTEFDVPAVISWLKYYASWVPIANVQYNACKPYGVIALVASVDTPLIALAWLLAPALAAGNCVCLCVPSKTSLTAMLLAEIFTKAGFPNGALNVILASQDTITQLVLHKDVSNVRAYGSTDFVRNIKQLMSFMPLKTISAVMPGRTPMLVFDSSDMQSAIESAVRSAWQNQGSSPWSVKQLLVQESIFLLFVKKLKLHLKGVRLGDSFEKLADVGKPYDSKVVENISKMSALAIENGLEVFQVHLTKNETERGYFPLTLLIGGEVVSNQVIEFQEYAPVISVVPFRTGKEAVALANNSRYGLAASIWTNKLTLAMDVSDRLQFGTVWINCHSVVDPSVAIHGWKQSGCGDFGGKSGYLQCLHLDEQTINPALQVDESSTPAARSPSTERYKMEVSYELYHSGAYKLADGNAARSIVINKQTKLSFSEANRKDVRVAVESAAGAFAGWSCNVSSRAQLLSKIAIKIDANQEKLIKWLQLSQQKKDSDTELSTMVTHVSAAFKYWAHVCDKSSELRVQKPGFMVNTSREPVGLVAIGIYCHLGLETSVCHQTAWQLAAALALGNPVLMVVDMMNPSGVLELFKTICEAGIPSGVLSVLTGNSGTVMKTLAEHQSVNAIFHWNYPFKLKQNIDVVASKNMKPVRSCIEESNSNPIAREFTELSVTRSKAVWVSKGEIFAN